MSRVEIQGASIDYGSGRHRVTAVSGVDLVIPQGACLGLVGESGSGKSTLGRALVGLTKLSAGSISVDGRAIDGRPRRDIQMVFQDPYASLDPRRRVGQSVAEGLSRSRGAAPSTRVEQLLEQVGLDARVARSYPGRISGGQRQRVALARALAAEPSVLVADEITAALDASVQGAILNLVRRVQRERGLSMLFISHNLAVVRYVADTIAVMYCGQIVEAGPSDQVLSNPEHPYTRSLLASVPSLEGSEVAAPETMGRPALADGLVDEPADPAAPPRGCRFHPRCPVGPGINSDRVVCREQDPTTQAGERRNRAACFFAAPAQVPPSAPEKSLVPPLSDRDRD